MGVKRSFWRKKKLNNTSSTLQKDVVETFKTERKLLQTQKIMEMF